MENQNNLILFPEYEALKKEVDKLRIELSMLVLERDNLLFIECKNIDTAYMIALGGLEYKAYHMQCDFLRLKRKMEIIQSKRNRQEKIIISQIEKILDDEFAQYQQILNEKLHQMNEAIRYSKQEILSEDDVKEIKKMYRKIIKALHPDLHPEISEELLALFHQAVEAYKNGDLYEMRLIDEMVVDPAQTTIKEDGITVLSKEKDRIIQILQDVADSIDKIKSEYPYTMKELVLDQEKIDQCKKELQDMIEQYKEAIYEYNKIIKEMLR